MNYTNAFHLAHDDRLTLLHSCSFSSALVDIFCALLNGATLYPWDVKQQGLVGLADWLVEQGVNVFNWSPTPFRYFVETASATASRLSFRLLVLGSEPVTQRDFELYREHFPAECLFANRLGTSETNNFRLYFANRETVLEGHVVPVGYAVADQAVLLLDDQGHAVAPGQVGQIAIQSSYLALGYWRRPELTEAVFLPDPNGGNERIYLTGDLGRMRSDGCLEHLGRKDFQVKIRGHRIETAEIETAIAALESVRDVVVVARERLGEQHLVAYLVLAKQAPLDTADLKHLLGQSLPDYMVPNTYVKLDELPVTATGKTDRKALPDPDWGALPETRGYVSPCNSTQAILTEIWGRLFGCRQVGIHDDFFEMGGYSLLAASLFAQIDDRFGQRLPLSTLLTAPTIAQLAEILAQESVTPSWSSLVPIQPNGSKPPLFFVHAHGGNVIGYYDLARLLGPDQPFFGLQAQGLDGRDPGFQCFEDMAAHYVRAIRAVQPQGPYFLGGWCYGGNLAKEMAHQLQEQGQTVAFLAMIQSTHCDYPQYLPGVTGLRRAIYRTLDRVEMEKSNFLEVDSSARWTYVKQRTYRVRTVIQVQTEKIVAALLARLNVKLQHSQAYELERLGERHNKLYRNYRPRFYRGPVTLFRAEKQRHGIQDDPTLGWASLIEGKLETCELPGHHIGLLATPRVHISAQRIKAALEKAQECVQSQAG
jgi:thioesterase domain-containing protein